MSDDLKPGDMVVLKSGSPKMTIVEIVNGLARCLYFVGNDLREANVSLCGLEQAKATVAEAEERLRRSVMSGVGAALPMPRTMTYHTAVGSQLPPVTVPPSGGVSFERFTDRARSVMVAADRTAWKWDDKAIGTEHLLAGVIENSKCMAFSVLASFGGVYSLADKLEVLCRRKSPHTESPTDRLPRTDRATKCLHAAMQEAHDEGASYVGSEHILLGLFAAPEGVAATVLTENGVTRDKVLVALKTLREKK